jgi:hypothetical protein
LNNRLFKFAPSAAPQLCDLSNDVNATIDVYDTSNALIGCNSTTTPAVVPGDCNNWWFYSDLCGAGAVVENANSILLEGQNITAVRYARANVGVAETGDNSSSVPLRVTSTGCLHLASKTQVVLGPGTIIEGRLHAEVY